MKKLFLYFSKKKKKKKKRGLTIRGKCDWHEHCEKSLLCFLNLGISVATLNKSRNVLEDEKKFTCQTQIN